MKKQTLFFILLLAQTLKLVAFDPFLDGTTLPESPWLQFLDGPAEEPPGETVIVDFVDPADGTNNQAVRIQRSTLRWPTSMSARSKQENGSITRALSRQAVITSTAAWPPE